VRTALQNGIDTINTLANAAPTSIDPVDAQNKLNKFLSDLNTACP
jgi:hypothetical protein